MLSGIATVNLSQLEAAFNTDLGDQQNPLQTENVIITPAGQNEVAKLNKVMDKE
jgi:hypothetical protein